MHIVPSLLTGLSLCLLVSCGHIYTKSDGYAESSSTEVNGAKVNAAFRANGGSGGIGVSAMVYMAGSAKLEGPFLWRVQAVGDEGDHESMVVHRVKVTTAKTKRSEWFPIKHLNEVRKFEPYSKTPGKSYAAFQMPGQLKVMPADDGSVQLLVDLSVVKNGKRVRRVVKFGLEPSETKELEFIFLPTEIAKGFNRDPREWEIKNDILDQ